MILLKCELCSFFMNRFMEWGDMELRCGTNILLFKIAYNRLVVNRQNSSFPCSKVTCIRVTSYVLRFFA